MHLIFFFIFWLFVMLFCYFSHKERLRDIETVPVIVNILLCLVPSVNWIIYSKYYLMNWALVSKFFAGIIVILFTYWVSVKILIYFAKRNTHKPED